MNQYYIIEIQKTAAGDYAHLVHWAYDEDEETARLKAESKYYEVLTAAALSDLASHSATLIDGEGNYRMSMCYKHNVTEPKG